MPLHEGRGYGILRSGGVEAFSAAKGEPVRGRLGGYGVGPGYRALLVAYQEKKMPFQVVKKPDNLR